MQGAGCRVKVLAVLKKSEPPLRPRCGGKTVHPNLQPMCTCIHHIHHPSHSPPISTAAPTPPPIAHRRHFGPSTSRSVGNPLSTE